MKDEELHTDDVYDLVGIGFGPSNLALTVAIDEFEYRNDIKSIFLEQKPSFSWHPHMLIPDTVMQISFLKDLVTQRNPGSEFSFINYLKCEGRLVDFINMKCFYPSRIEFDLYMTWAAEKLNDYVKYGCVVTSVTAQNSSSKLAKISYLDLTTGQEKAIYARNIVTAVGGIPSIPFALELKNNSENVWHSSQYLKNIESLGNRLSNNHHFVVIGRGQSSAEIANDLYNKYDNASVTCIFRGYCLKPSDSSEFVNEVFDPSFIDDINTSPKELREKIIAEHGDTNYSVVDAPLISRLYELQYHETISGHRRLNFRNLSSVQLVTESENDVQVHVKNVRTNEIEQINANTVVMATGYDYPNPPKVLEPIAKHFLYDKNSLHPIVSRNYRVSVKRDIGFNVYLQGCNEATHGLGDTLLSNLAIRSGDILKDLHKNGHGDKQPQPQQKKEQDIVAA